jgi:hypothetical protein
MTSSEIKAPSHPLFIISEFIASTTHLLFWRILYPSASILLGSEDLSADGNFTVTLRIKGDVDIACGRFLSMLTFPIC